MAIILQPGTEDNLPIIKGTGGLEELRADPPNQLPLVKFKETGLKELLRLHYSQSRERLSRFLLVEVVIQN